MDNISGTILVISLAIIAVILMFFTYAAIVAMNSFEKGAKDLLYRATHSGRSKEQDIKDGFPDI